MSIFDNLPPSEGWGNAEKTNGEVRTLLNILLNLGDNENVCDFVVMANVYEGDPLDESHHEIGVSHRGIVYTSVPPEELPSFIAEAMRPL